MPEIVTFSFATFSATAGHVRFSPYSTYFANGLTLFFFGTYFANGRTSFANCQTLLDFFHNQFRQLAYIVWFFIRNIFRQLPDIVRFSFGTYFANWRALLDFLLEHTPFRQLSGIVGLPFRANNTQRNPLFKGVWCV